MFRRYFSHCPGTNKYEYEVLFHAADCCSGCGLQLGNGPGKGSLSVRCLWHVQVFLLFNLLPSSVFVPSTLLSLLIKYKKSDNKITHFRKIYNSKPDYSFNIGREKMNQNNLGLQIFAVANQQIWEILHREVILTWKQVVSKSLL